MITYKHEPFTDFSKEENKQAFKAGLDLVESYLGKDYPLVIGGEKITTDEKSFRSTLPIKKKSSDGYRKLTANWPNRQWTVRLQPLNLGKSKTGNSGGCPLQSGCHYSQKKA